MRSKNTHVRYDAVPYGEVAHLLSDSLPGTATVHRHEAAVDALRRADDGAVLAAAPTGMAVGVRLASIPLTVVELSAVPAEALTGVESADRPIAAYELLAFGQFPERANRSLREFASSP
ncbi:hypothetical protein JCM30237_24700 [Halolamina litorea]|uniref:DUF8165 domain-containing protein n=1 Tax=Halolamina litorea TaxID=1515593 RepID=A0ABD6BTQ3_9EURY|nr:hypothetical protein [Halolamina litorea]